LITILAGGTGSVKLVRGLARVAKDIAVVCNVGDNIWLYDFYICPDIDTILYGLAGMLDLERGWGVRGDTFSFMAQMKRMGQPSWFKLGDRDLAMHACRTEMLRRGKNLTEVTSTIARTLDIGPKILPATDDDVATMISTSKGRMHIQEFWVKHMAGQIVTGVNFQRARRAKPTRQVVEAIRRSDMVVVSPANPVSSIGPMLAIVDIRRELQRVREKVVAVSPIIGDMPVSGPAAKYMKALGLEVSAAGVAGYYKDVSSSIVVAKTDKDIVDRIGRFGMTTLATDIMMRSPKGEDRLARFLMEKMLS
jgi:LPPG:FO 2-phospho-L-lactate transferase